MTYTAFPAASRAWTAADSGAADSTIGRTNAARKNSVRAITSIPADVEHYAADITLRYAGLVSGSGWPPSY